MRYYHLQDMYEVYYRKTRKLNRAAYEQSARALPPEIETVRHDLHTMSIDLRGKGHLITHPFRRRPESKGEKSGITPDKITT